jgi:hypothetical protein
MCGQRSGFLLKKKTNVITPIASCDGRILVQLHGQLMPIADTHSWTTTLHHQNCARYNVDSSTGMKQYISYTSIGSEWHRYDGDNVHDRIIRSIHRSFNSDRMHTIEEQDADGDYFEFKDNATLLESILGGAMARGMEKWPERRAGAATPYF